MLPCLLRFESAILLTLVLSAGNAVWSAVLAQAGTIRSSVSGAELLRLQQAQAAASDYYRYAKNSSNYSYSQYGHFGAAFERVDNVLNKGRQHFNEYEISELNSRILGLKQRVSATVSQGLEPLEYQDDITNLEAEVVRKVEDSLVTIGSTERQLTDVLNRLEELFNGNKSKMSETDREELDARLTRLRNRTVRESLVSAGITHGSYSAEFVEEARKIESAIISKTLFNNHTARATEALATVTTATAAKGSSRDSSGASQDSPGASQDFPTAASAPKLHSGISTYRLQPVVQRENAPPRPKISLAQAFERTENRLVDLHEKERLGSFDIDVFSERILKLKYNCRKMVSDSGTLSPRQENWLRVELDKINSDISERGHYGE